MSDRIEEQTDLVLPDHIELEVFALEHVTEPELCCSGNEVKADSYHSHHR